jgi:hypothetical protein
MSDKWVTTEEGGLLTGYCQEHLRRLARQGKVEAEKKSGIWFLDRESLLEHQAATRPGRPWPSKEERANDG